MRSQWSTIKHIIGDSGLPEDKFISLINGDGKIVSANSKMIRALDLKNPRYSSTNFFDLIHPVNRMIFQDSLIQSEKKMHHTHLKHISGMAYIIP